MAFLGLSSSIVNQVGSTVGKMVSNPFNRNFFYWYFFPALAFIFFQRFLVGPVAFDIAPPNFVEYANAAFATPAPEESGGEEAAPLAPAATPAPDSQFARPDQ
ncbi:MAG: hypothetical protein AAB217_06495, partial [Chloroflexota bacterium]